RPRPCHQTLGALAAEGGQPSPDAPGSDTEEVSNLLGRVPLDNALDSEASAALKLNGCTYGSHARHRCKPQARLTLATRDAITPEKEPPPIGPDDASQVTRRRAASPPSPPDVPRMAGLSPPAHLPPLLTMGRERAAEAPTDPRNMRVRGRLPS